MLYIITYDIPDDRCRTKVAKILEGYGKRVQYSVFECDISDKLLKELKSKLRKKVDMEKDSIRFYSISYHTRGQIDVWNGPPVVEPAESVIV
jgi:CRISPR-associated protein Cas2